MRKFGLLGKSLGHSWSGDHFKEKFRKEHIHHCTYENIPMDELDRLREVIGRDKTISGLNVTIPYKIEILKYLDAIDSRASRIGAVNCIQISHTRNGIYLKGYNTDSEAFRETLVPLIVKKGEIKGLVLGTGGAARAVSLALEELNISHLLVSRTAGEGILTYNELTGPVISDHHLIINATPLGMFPGVEQYPPISYDHTGRSHLLYDLIYNPSVTRFLQKGLDMGAQIKNGLEMLHRQAELSWRIWN